MLHIEWNITSNIRPIRGLVPPIRGFQSNDGSNPRIGLGLIRATVDRFNSTSSCNAYTHQVLLSNDTYFDSSCSIDRFSDDSGASILGTDSNCHLCTNSHFDSGLIDAIHSAARSNGRSTFLILVV